jgi:hypothetical protein
MVAPEVVVDALILFIFCPVSILIYESGASCMCFVRGRREIDEKSVFMCSCLAGLEIRKKEEAVDKEEEKNMPPTLN